MKFDRDESLGQGLRYTETVPSDRQTSYPFLRLGWVNSRRSGRLCQLWAEGVKEPVGYLTLFSYESRIGEVIVPVEGVGGLATPPAWRRRGYASKLLRKAVESATERVDLLYLNGVSGFYRQQGFASCLHKSELRLDLKAAEAARGLAQASTRPMEPDDLGVVCDLANRARACHSGTTVRRTESFAGPRLASDWDPGEEGIVLERNGVVEGYLIFARTSFGGAQPFTVSELVGADHRVTEALVGGVYQLAFERRLGTIPFHEVPSSPTGRVLAQLGCEARIQYESNSGWMARILRREPLVRAIAPELERRAGQADRAALESLAVGEMYPDDAVLLPLLTGYQSWRDAARAGSRAPSRHEAIVHQWFAGAGGCDMPLPYAYRLDWY